jgi:hypothetical protein
MTTLHELPTPEVTSSVCEWIEEVDALLARLEVAFEVLQLETGDAGPEAKRNTQELLVVLRQLRADAPRPERVKIWLRAVASEIGVRRLYGPARFINAAGESSRESPTGA